MISKSRRAIMAALLVLMVGCTQSPATMRPAVQPAYYYGSTAPAPPYDYVVPFSPAHPPRVSNDLIGQSAPRPRQHEPVNVADDHLSPKPAPVLRTPADPECTGWWRLCHFL
jgi:hypothetical protein